MSLLDRPYLLMDETTVQVLKEPGKSARSRSPNSGRMMSAGPGAAHRAVRV